MQLIGRYYVRDVKVVSKRSKKWQNTDSSLSFLSELRLSYGIPFFILESFNSVLKSRLLSASERRT